jgi:transposase
MDCHQADATEQAAWRSSGERPSRPQWHLLGLAIRSSHEEGRVGQHPAEKQSQRSQLERFFNRIKQCRRVATRYDSLGANYLAFVQLASIRLWLRLNESAA